MGNSYFQFRQFRVEQDRCAMKVCTDSCLFGAWVPVAHDPQRILDIGTGTGLLALILAQRTQARIDAVELHPGAAQQAMENTANSPWPDRIRVHQGDIVDYRAETPYDLIVCNPPFFEHSLASDDDGEKLAKHGLSLQRLFESVESLVHEQSRFALLLPFNRHDDVQALAQRFGWQVHETLSVSNRPHGPAFRFMVLLGKTNPGEVKKETLAIYETSGNAYTAGFIERLSHLYCETAMYR